MASCLVLVGLALWQRSQNTARIRQFWGPRQASLIQHAPLVYLDSLPDKAQPRGAEQWQNISASGGLVHLRATLVDDRYFQWDRSAAIAAGNSAGSSGKPSRYSMRFSDGSQHVDLSIDTSTGIVTNLATQQNAILIDASRQAIAHFLERLILTSSTSQR